ncbi:MAG TPA: T9SS type A sorting domain-containing protein, partial [Bacteroidetes bacterium]|nr:T9SS type A sorting domain-containing protein [Bacteroidota bacterium]
HTVYNYLHLPEEGGDGELLAEPGDAERADAATRSGYCCLAVLPCGREDPADNDLGVVFFHSQGYQGAPDDQYVSTTQLVDFMRAFGAFDASYPPAFPNTQFIWPHGAVDGNNASHVVSCQYFGEDGPIWHRIGYWRGTVDDEFIDWTWPEVPVNLDTVAVISQIASASPTSERVVLAWHHSRVGIPTGPWEEFGGFFQHNNDIQYIVSDDGEEWDWDNGIQTLTNILPVRPDLWAIDSTEAYGDTFRPYCDIDIQFDPWGNDELYATFATNGFWEYTQVNDRGWPASQTGEHDILWFWSSREDTITMIYDGWYFNRTDQNGLHSRCGGWRMNADRGSIAFNPDDAGTIYVVWCNFPKIMEPTYDDNGNFTGWDWLEGATDTSGLGFSNAEIMVSISTDYGITWQEPYNITGTRWENDQAPDVGDCMSENWPSAAYVADDSLHIMYILDGESGGWPQADEGDATNNQVIYQRVALEDLDHDRDPVELPREDFQFHNYLDYRPYVEDQTRDPGVPTPNNDVNVRAIVLAGGDQELVNVELQYVINGPGDIETVDMEQIEGDTWAAAIPGQEEGTRVWYRVHATNDADFDGYGPSAVWYWSYVVREEGGLTIQDVQSHPREWGVDYSPYRGYEVTVQGVVTTPATFNQQFGAYVIQNGPGDDWAGIYVRGIEADLNEGDLIEVTGTVMERDPEDPGYWEYATYIDVTDYEVIEQSRKPAPLLVDLGELVWAERAEQLEGVYVEVRDFEIGSIDAAALDLGYWKITDNTGDAWFTTNGLTEEVIKDRELFLDTGQGEGLVHNTWFEWMKGVFTENNGYYAIAPTGDEDVGPLTVREDGASTPYRFRLDQPYPNPFNAVTNVGVELSHSGYARLALYDLTGREVAVLVAGEMSAGRYNFTVDASSFAAGVYIVRLETDLRSASRKVILMK